MFSFAQTHNVLLEQKFQEVNIFGNHRSYANIFAVIFLIASFRRLFEPSQSETHQRHQQPQTIDNASVVSHMTFASNPNENENLSSDSPMEKF